MDVIPAVPAFLKKLTREVEVDWNNSLLLIVIQIITNECGH